MGNSKSLPETPQQRQRRLERERGVLIPPSFINDYHAATATATATSNTLPISRHAHLLVSQSTSPSLLDYLWNTSAGTRLLQDYMQPGISVHIPTTTTTTTPGRTTTDTTRTERNHIYIHLPLVTPLPSSMGNNQPPMMILAAQQSIGRHFNVQILLPTLTHTHTTTNVPPTAASAASTPTTTTRTHSSRPSLQVSAVSPCSHFGLQACFPLGSSKDAIAGDSEGGDALLNPSNGEGWFEARYKGQIKDGLEVVASSWMTWKHLRNLSLPPGSFSAAKKPTTNTASSSSSSSPPELNVQLGVEYEESLWAVQTKLPLCSTLFSSSSSTEPSLPTIESLLSINLNHRSDPTSSEEERPTSAPPLWLSLQQTYGPSHSTTPRPISSSLCWTLNLSQILTWDRRHWNLLDDRAPTIRQTLGWVVQVEQQPEPPPLPQQQELSSSSSPSMVWSAGASMQWNRHLATKLLWKENGQVLNTTILLKQWKEPSVTLSVLHSMDMTLGKTKGWGIGFEMEASSSSGSASVDTPAAVGRNTHSSSPNYPESPTPSRSGPPTKIHLPTL